MREVVFVSLSGNLTDAWVYITAFLKTGATHLTEFDVLKHDC